MNKVRLFVIVQDDEHKIISNAIVKGRKLPKGQFQTLRYNETFQRYTMEKLSLGQFEIQVKGEKGSTTERRIITLKNGDNHIQVMLGKNKMLSFKTKGINYYFDPVNDKLLLTVRGENAEEKIKKILKPTQIKYELLPDKQGRVVSDDILIILNIGKGEKEKKNRAALERIVMQELPSMNLRSHLGAVVYKDEKPIMGITNEIIVKFKDAIKIESIQELTEKLNLTVERNIHYLGNAYLLKSHTLAHYNILNKIKTLLDFDEIDYAEPNTFQTAEHCQYTPNDYLYNEISHLGIINCGNAWELLDELPGMNPGGNPNVIIAVLDIDGVDPTHPDLTGILSDGTQKMSANFDFVNMNNQTFANLGGHHGTQCSGSATARMNNNQGTVGVAPNCHLIGGRLPAAGTYLEWGDIWIWMAGLTTSSTDPNFPGQLIKGADIISNSWGYPVPIPPSQVLSGIFEFLVTHGRAAMGCLVCFATGNLGYRFLDNFNPLAADENTLAIGASINSNPTNPCNSMQQDHNGNLNNLPAVMDTRSYFSPYGLTVDIVSPSHTCYDLALPGVGIRDPIISCANTDGGDWPGRADVQTTINDPAGVAAGQTNIPVVDSTGFVVNEFALFNNPGDIPNETRRILAVGPGLITTQALEFNYPNGTVVSSGPNDYAMNPRIGFGGTSHSCPTVAGAAALILSIKPDLSWKQVKQILCQTAVHIDSLQANNIGQWIDFDGDNIIDFSQWYGHGRLDVRAALEATIKISSEGEVMNIINNIQWQRHKNAIITTNRDRKALVPLLRQTGIERVHTQANSEPSGVIFDGSYIWVANSGSGTVSKIDINNNVVVARIQVGTQPRGFAFDGNYIWVSNYGSNNISKIDAQSNAVVDTIGGITNPKLLAFDGSYIWVLSDFAANIFQIIKIHPTANAVISTLNRYHGIYDEAKQLAFDGEYIWVLTNRELIKINVAANVLLSWINTSYSSGLAFDGTDLWITNRNNLSRFNILNNTIQDNYSIVSTYIWLDDIIFDGTHLWISCHSLNRIYKFHPTGIVVKSIGVGNNPKALAFDGTHVWVTNSSPPFHGNISDYFVTKIPALPLGYEIPADF